MSLYDDSRTWHDYWRANHILVYRSIQLRRQETSFNAFAQTYESMRIQRFARNFCRTSKEFCHKSLHSCYSIWLKLFSLLDQELEWHYDWKRHELNCSRWTLSHSRWWWDSIIEFFNNFMLQSMMFHKVECSKLRLCWFERCVRVNLS